MKNRKKIWSIVAICCIAAGLIMSVSAITAAGFDFSKFNSVQYEEKTYTISDSFENIEIAADWETVELLPSKSQNCQVVCSENDDLQYTVKVEDNILKIERHEDSQWFENICIFWFSSSPGITVYLPEREYKNLKVATSSGDIIVSEKCAFSAIDAKTASGNLSFNSAVSKDLHLVSSSGNIFAQNFAGDTLKIESASGIITLEDCTSESMWLTSTSGDMVLTKTLAKQEMNLQASSGNISLSECDAPQIVIQTSSGDVGGSLLSGKEFSAITSSGDVILPEDSSETEKCSIITSSGNIRFTIQG